MTFSESDYCSEEFSELSSEKESIKSRRFEDCEFNSCLFVDCRFEKCSFIKCTFNGCVLSAIIPVDSRFIDVTFAKSKAVAIDWTKAQKLQGLVFEGCQVDYSNFRLLNMPKIKMANCEAREVEFIETDLNGGDFRNTDFKGSRFLRADLSEADFRGARNYFIDVKNNTLRRARFSLPEALVLLEGLDVVID